MAGVNFLHVAVVLFVVCTVILVGVSLVTAPPAPERIATLTYRGAGGAAAAPALGARRTNVMLSVLLAGAIGVLWIIFR